MTGDDGHDQDADSARPPGAGGWVAVVTPGRAGRVIRGKHAPTGERGARP
ncbi:MAG TPA: hypothetical protein VGY50_12215 [Streptosporangiaceae bacterium]|nr:hypothetical protein [Streptosporangiaceae bacterium]